MAVAASILTVVYHMIRNGTSYTDLGFTYFQQSDRDRIVRGSVARLEQLGYLVTLTKEVA